MAIPAPLLARLESQLQALTFILARSTPDEILGQLRALRAELVALVRGLSPAETARTGLHPTFGEMDVTAWLEFFLLHEAHHLYIALVRVGEAGRA